jgi:Tol biopolymer transport system component
MRAVSRRVALLAAMGLALAACGGSDEPAGGNSATATTATATTASAARSPIAAVKAWIAYTSLSDRGPDGVFLVRPDGSDDHEIALEVPGLRFHPDFARDGKRLAFDQRTSDNDPDQVYIAAADGSGARQLTKCQPPKCAGLWEPAWSPDGKKLAIATSYGFHPGAPSDRFGIGTIDVATGKVKAVVDHDFPTGQDHLPRWSPDGRRLVFWRDVEQEQKIGVFVVNVDGSGQRQLTKWDMQAGDADWSPDGKLIVFATYPLANFQAVGHSELYTIRPDGKGLRRLTSYGPDGPRAAHPRWTPDGKGIIYVRTTQEGRPRHLYYLSADGKQDVPVLTAKPVYTHPILQPVS